MKGTCEKRGDRNIIYIQIELFAQAVDADINRLELNAKSKKTSSSARYGMTKLGAVNLTDQKTRAR
jgi:hypothetical protein